jgi:hypothetical protein
VIGVKLQIKQKGLLSGDNSPFGWGGGLFVDVCRGMFGSGSGLPFSDFNFLSGSRCTAAVGKFGNTPSSAWYTANLNDFLSFFSGNNTMPYLPLLFVEYYVP